MKKKYLLLLLIIFLLTGCKVDYKININKDLTVVEEIKMTGTEEFFKLYNKTSKTNVLKMLLEEDENVKLLIENGYEYELKEGKEPYVIATKKYSSLEEYQKNTIFKNQIFEDINISKSGKKYHFETGEFIPNDEEEQGRYFIRDLTVNVSSYYMLDGNYETKDDKNNILKYKLKDTSQDFNVNFSVNTLFRHIPNFKIYVFAFIFGIALFFFWRSIYKTEKKKKKDKKDENFD